MHRPIILLLIHLISIHFTEQVVPEICDNGWDDDQDGKIDLNDEDCYCEPLEQISFIPNPSFENQECCPSGPSRMDCAEGWVQASAGTTDYFHACDYNATDIFDLPLPVPEGEGFAGFIDGALAGQVWKEYMGACLLTPLQPDTLYRLEFYTGFLDRNTSPDIEIALFGTTDCDNLPFGDGDKAFGCPSNSPDWMELGSVTISGQNQWVKSQFKVRTQQEIKAIALGPGCNPRIVTVNPYHFLDDITLKENANFDLGIQSSGQPCTNNLVFEIKAQEGYEYQWYQDGIAIPEATSRTLPNPPGRGQYQVRLKNNEGCKISTVYTYSPPSDFVEVSQNICAGETFRFNNQQLTEAGIYWDTLTTINYCDSIVKMELSVNPAVKTQVSAKLFPDEFFRIGPYTINSPGEHRRTIPAKSGCDSTVYLKLEYYDLYIPNAFSPNGDYINDVFSLYGTTDVKEITSLHVFDRWGALLYQGEGLQAAEGWDGTINGKEAQVGVYVYVAQLLMVDNKKRMVEGILTLVK